jgi:hypothetical protein
MAVLEFGKYILVSRPRFNAAGGHWLPYASALWMDRGELHYHRFKLDRTFDTEEDALLFGFLMARMWVETER